MIYLKSVFGGLVALVLSAVLIPIIMALAYKSSGTEGFGWDPVSFVKRPVAWILILLILSPGFFLGFCNSSQ